MLWYVSVCSKQRGWDFMNHSVQGNTLFLWDTEWVIATYKHDENKGRLCGYMCTCDVVAI